MAGSHALNLDSIAHPPYRLYVIAPLAELLPKLGNLHVHSALVGWAGEHASSVRD